MTFTHWIKSRKLADWVMYLSIAVIVAGIFFRAYKLTFPDKQVFDEVYFPVFANNYLERVSFYDVHPPLGKFIIALGISLFGNQEFGWRIFPLLFGIGNIILMGLLAARLTKRPVLGWVAAALVAGDGMFIAYSRVGLMDGILFFMIFLALYSATSLEKSYTSIWSGLLVGLAAAIKWPAVAVMVPMLWWAQRGKQAKEFAASLILGGVVYFLIVAAGQWLIRVDDPLGQAIVWHYQAFHYHATVTEGHPWGSVWWTWVIPLRPVLFLYDTTASGSIQMMSAFGNPLLWISSGVAVVASIVRVLWLACTKKQFWKDVHFPLVLGHLAMWLPWAFIGRVLFLYHYFPSYGFALLLLVLWLEEAWKRGLAWMVLAFLVVATAVAALYLPWAVGWWSLSLTTIKHMVLIRTWLW